LVDSDSVSELPGIVSIAHIQVASSELDNSKSLDSKGKVGIEWQLLRQPEPELFVRSEEPPFILEAALAM
jgi:hypothetical protein